MREILFRGKSLKTNEWVYDFYVGFRHALPKITDIKGNNYTVIPETLGQFTGLTDRNGTKIFEGDILKYYKKLFFVEYNENLARFLVRKPNGIFTSNVFYYCEIVGNIYDTPELLKGD